MVVIIAGLVGLLFYTNQVELGNYKLEIANNLASISKKEVDSILFWRRERLSDARVVAGNHTVIAYLKYQMGLAFDQDELLDLDSTIRIIAESYQYDNILLTSPSGNVLYSLYAVQTRSGQGMADLVSQAYRQTDPMISNPYQLKEGGKVLLDIVSMVRDDQGEPLGAVILVADPQLLLYPQILEVHRQPPSLESFLVRRAGNQIILLSPLYHQEFELLDPIATLDQLYKPSVQAARGVQGFVEGRDFQEVPVMADVRRIEGSDWLLVTKASSEELLAGYYDRRLIYMLLFTSVITLLLLAGFGMYGQAQSENLKKLMAAQALLGQAQSELVSALNATSEGFMTADALGLVTRANQTAQQLLEQPSEMLIGQPLAAIFLVYAPGPNGQLHAPLAMGLHGSLAAADGSGSLRKEGALVQVSFSLSAVLGARDELLGWVLVFRDRTAELRAEQELLETNQKYADLFEFSPEALAVVEDGSMKILQVNQATAELTGRSAQELVGMNTMVLGTFADQAERSVAMALARQGKGFFNAEFLLTRVNGEQRNLLVSSRPVQMGQGKAWLVGIRDITELLEAQRREREREALLLAIIDNAPSGIWVRDANQRMIYENKHIVNVYGSRLNMNLDDLSPELQQPTADWKIVNARVLKGETVSYPEEYTRDGQTFYMQKIVTPIVQDGNVTGILGFNIDITELKLAEKELLREREDLRRSNTELEQFAYVASHDLQEPLRMVTSYLQLLERRYRGKLDDKADEFIGYAVDGAATMQRLILDLLMYSRVGTRAKPTQPIEADHALQKALANLRFAIQESGGEVEAEPLPAVLADETQLAQVFQNLVGNSLKFAKPGEAPKVRVACKEQGEFWRFTVSDNGIGIDPRFADRVFVIFQRLNEKGQYPGTGIGLAICKKIVNRHGGEIWVESQPGQGATFHFTLPRKAATE